MNHLSGTLTIILDALGLMGVFVGGYVALKSTYVRENTKDAAILIDTQRKRIDNLEDTVVRLDKENVQLRKESHRMSGELNAYRRLNYIEPEVITKLTTTLDSILLLLSKNGLTITQGNNKNEQK